ncbi:MAG TPA: hypothetical protein ENJ28_09580 [Gammaproteobacteria bacterium]|nr:hypothetical protein [Gammaproteobacteria bacterium]
MRRIKQADPTGCGLACIAMLASSDYNNVREVAIKQLGFNDSGTFHTSTKDLRELARKFKIELGKRRRKFKRFEGLPETAILAINHMDASDTWHWVVYRRRSNDTFVYDPKKSIKTNKRRDFGHIKARWYLPVIGTYKANALGQQKAPLLVPRRSAFYCR